MDRSDLLDETVQVLIGLVIGYAIGLFAKTPRIVRHVLVWQKRRTQGRDVEFVFDPEHHGEPKLTGRKKVYVAGQFNNWWGTQDKNDPLYGWEKARYRMAPVKSETKTVWRLRLKLEPGEYDFKFRTGDHRWYGWHDGCRYGRGNDAPGGANLKVSVEERPAQ